MINNSKYTKWIPLMSFNHDYSGFIIMARMKIKTGMIYFKQKKIYYDCTGSLTPKLNPDIQFEILMNEGNFETVERKEHD